MPRLAIGQKTKRDDPALERRAAPDQQPSSEETTMAEDNLQQPTGRTIGLQRFATAWVERWLANGGSVAVGSDGHATLFAVANASDVPGYQPPPEDWPENLRADRLRFDDLLLCGRTRELIDLLDVVTGGREAVKDHVCQYPSHAYMDGRRDLA
jgi:hypothetical protein